MRKVDVLFVQMGVLYGAFGMGFGIWMGASGNLQFHNTHAHINLLGFVAFVLFGFAYKL